MFDFRTVGGANFSYDVDFKEANYANISFFDDTRISIPFHLSLRAERSLAVFNRRDGNQWQDEEVVNVAFKPGLNRVELRFDPPQTTVLLNGAAIFRLTQNSCPDTETITCLSYQGAVLPASVHLGGKRYQGRRGRGEISFAQPFYIAGWGFEPGATQMRHMLEIEGMEEPLRPGQFDRPEIARREGALSVRIGIKSLLPGRVWLNVPDGAPLNITLTCNGAPCGAALSLTRPEALAQLEAIAGSVIAEQDAFTALLALEHIRHGDFLAELSSAAHAWALATATFYNLGDFLQPSNAETTTAALALTAPEPPPLDELLVEELRTRFTLALRQPAPQEAADGKLVDLLPELPPRGSEARRLSYLVLAEIFCAHDAFEELYALAAAEGLPAFNAEENAWHNSVILPFLYAQHRFEELRSILWSLTEPRADWIVTSTLAWVMHQIVQDPLPQLSEQTREELVYPFLDFIERRAGLYWERSECQHLIGAMVQLLAARDSFPAYLVQRLQQTAVTVYGLSQDFWNTLARTKATSRPMLSGDLAAAQENFRILARHSTGKPPTEAVARALRFFERFDNRDAARFRIELLGPAGTMLPTTPGTAAILTALRDSPVDPAQAAMRHLAFPRSALPAQGESETAALATLAREAVATAHKDVPRAPYHDLQGRLSRNIAALLTELAGMQDLDEAPLRPRLAALLADMRSLSRGRSKFIGLALALVLMNGLMQLGANRAARRLLGEIGAMRATLSPPEVETLRQAPALASALYALRQTDGPQAHPLLSPLLRYFPGVLAALPPPHKPTPSASTLPSPHPLFDTLVTVISCRAYLADRIPALEAAWLHRLESLGIPYVVVVGGADAPRLDGNMLHLAVDDDYESLPQKVLATVDWVLNETGFGHMLKIDDDCFLDVEEFFHSQSWRKFHYYGRALSRDPGNTDRSWHFAKSRSARGRLELDKSPEPSSYADGGSGYALSRTAMATVISQSTKTKGQQLLQSSFMEDKAIGDLLSLGQISVADEDYFASVQRRTHATALPVSIWANGFWPSRASGVKLVHLDSAALQPRAADTVETMQLFPHKIWPSYSQPLLGSNSNLLELISPVDTLERLNAEALAVVACTRNEMFMLPHFLAHYRAMGVKAFLIADNTSDDGTLEYLARQPDVAVFSVDSEYRISQYGVAWQQAILSNFRVGRWSLVADADEFLVTGTDPGTAPALSDVLAEAEAEGADALRLFMLDLYPEGPLSKTDFASGDLFAEAGSCDTEPFLTNCPSQGPYSNAPTWTSSLRHRLIPNSRAELFVAQKIALLNYRPWMRLSAGLHYVAGVRLAQRQLVFAHFKYHAEFRRKAQAEVNRRQHFNNAEEYRRYLALMSEGREVIYKPGLSCPWQDSPDVQAILAPPVPQATAGRGFAAKPSRSEKRQ